VTLENKLFATIALTDKVCFKFNTPSIDSTMANQSENDSDINECDVNLYVYYQYSAILNLFTCYVLGSLESSCTLIIQGLRQLQGISAIGKRYLTSTIQLMKCTYQFTN
jgi:hypothetical protein